MQATSAGQPAPNQSQTSDLLDVRGIQPPDNVLKVLKRVSELPKGAGLQLRIDANPWQLYDLLQQRGYFLQVQRDQDGAYSGVIRQREIDQLKH